MKVDFDKLPRFKHSAMTVLTLVPQWAHAYQVPEDAIVAQIYTAHAWADSNPKRAPKKNVTRFLWSWMGSAKRYGNLVVRKQEAPRAPEAPPAEDMTFEEMQAIRQQNFPQHRSVA